MIFSILSAFSFPGFMQVLQGKTKLLLRDIAASIAAKISKIRKSQVGILLVVGKGLKKIVKILMPNKSHITQPKRMWRSQIQPKDMQTRVMFLLIKQKFRIASLPNRNLNQIVYKVQNPKSASQFSITQATYHLKATNISLWIRSSFDFYIKYVKINILKMIFLRFIVDNFILNNLQNIK